MSEIAIPTALPQGFWDNDVASMPETAADWLWPGFVSRHNMTLLTSLWKAGKTTLLAHFLARRSGGQPLLDRPIAPGKTVVISEEPRTLWADRCRRFAFGGNVCLFPQPFANLPSNEEWRSLLQVVAKLHAEQGVDLLVIDSLTHFLHGENVAQCVLDFLLPVRALTTNGMAALLMHHPRRHGAGAGVAGRGHGAVHTEVDISIEMRHASGNLDSRSRQFFCMSRHSGTPRRLQFELNADGSDYVLQPETASDGFLEYWDVLHGVLEDAPQKLTRQDILDEWPADFAKPAANTLWRWLEQAVESKFVNIEGIGRKADPFRYWIDAAEARWRENPFHEIYERQVRDLKLPYVSLRESKARQTANDRAVDAPLPKGTRLWPPGSVEE